MNLIKWIKKYDWDDVMDNPLTFGGLFLGLFMCFALEYISFFLFKYLTVFWIASIIFILLLIIFTIVFIMLSKTAKGSWLFFLVMVIGGFVMGNDISNLYYFQKTPPLENIKVEEAYNSSNLVSVKFTNHKLLEDKFIYKSHYTPAKHRHDVKPAQYWANGFLPLVDSAYNDEDVKFVLFLEGRSSTNKPDIKGIKNKLIRLKYKFLEVVEDEDFKNEVLSSNDRNFKLAPSFLLLRQIDKEKSMIYGDPDDFHNKWNYFAISLIYLILGIPTWIGTCAYSEGPWWWIRD